MLNCCGHDLVEGGLHAVELEFAYEVEELGQIDRRPAALVKTVAVFPPGSPLYSSTAFNRKTLYSRACGMAAPAPLCR
jgi:hypothetical protein